jgi:hypothetical protein
MADDGRDQIAGWLTAFSSVFALVKQAAQRL